MNHSQSTDEELLGALLDQLVNKHRTGEPVGLEEVCDLHPHLAGRLRDLYSTLCVMEQHKPVREPLAEPPMAIRSSDSTIGGYHLVREIGRGGMGVVYEAVQLSLGRHVAIKIMSGHLMKNAKAVERFRREARLASRLHHSNIVPVFDVGQDAEVCFYAMQFIHGQSLDQVIAELRNQRLRAASHALSRAETNPLLPSDQTLDPAALARNAARIGMQVADALAYAHSLGILHRDIKPSNIIIDKSGNAWIADFGLAALDDSTTASNQGALTETGDVLGTLRYLAPERLRGDNDHRCDIYGLAATIYELLTQRPTFEAVDRVHLMEMLNNVDPVKPRTIEPRIPRDLETILLKGLSKSPEARYQDAMTMADDFRLFILDRPIQARRSRWLAKAVRWCRRNRVATGLGATLLATLFLIGFGVFATRSLQTQRDHAMRMYARATTSENESAIRATLNDLAAFRLTLEPELAPLQERLGKIETAQLSDELRLKLRNEAASCLFRSDWYREPVAVELDAAAVAFDRDAKLLAIADRSGVLRLVDFPSMSASGPSAKLGFVPDDVRFSRGNRFIIASKQGNFSVIARESMQPLSGLPTYASGCDVSDEQQLAAFWSGDQNIVVVSLAPKLSPKIKLEYRALQPVVFCSLSPDGKQLAVLDQNSLVMVETESGKVLHSLPLNHNNMLEWSPNGNWIAVTDSSYRIQIRDAATLELRSIIASAGSFVYRIRWDRDSRFIIFQTWGSSTIVANAWTGRTLVRTRQPMGTAEFSADNRFAGWHVGDGKVSRIRWRAGLVQDVSPGYLPDNERMILAAIHPSLPILAIVTNKRIFWCNLGSEVIEGKSFSFRPLAIQFKDDGSEVVLLGSDSIQRWHIDFDESTRRATIKSTSLIEAPPQLSGFVLPTLETAISTTQGNELIELDLRSGARIKSLGSAEPTNVRRVGDSEWCALIDWHSDTIRLRDFRTGQTIGDIKSGQHALLFANPDMSQFIITNGQAIRFLNPQNLEQSAFEIPSTIVGGQVAWLKEGNEVVVQTAASYLDLLDAESHRLLCRLESDPVDGLTTLQWDSKRQLLIGLCQGTGLVRCWDIGQLRSELNDVRLGWNTSGMVTTGGTMATADTTVTKMAVGENSVEEPAPQSRSLDLISISIDASELDSQREAFNRILLAEARAKLSAQPSSVHWMNSLAWRLLVANEPDRNNAEAEQLSRQVAAAEPMNPMFSNTLALALYRLGKFDEARVLLEINVSRSSAADLNLDLAVLALIARATGDERAVQQFKSQIARNRVDQTNLSVDHHYELDLLQAELDLLPKPPSTPLAY